MNITLFGHATLLIQTQNATCLMDPVFFDPFEDGAVESCPKREVFLNKLPKLDCIIISHQHLDHFDIQTLLKLQRNVTVFIPDDNLIKNTLHALNFQDVVVIKPFQTVTFKDLTLIPTTSRLKEINEFGVIFKTKDGTCWNQVDSDCPIDEIPKYIDLTGEIDLLIAKYASQNFSFFTSLNTNFPHEEYAYNLARAVETNPRAIVPGAAGFRFSDPHLWLNNFLFPISDLKFLTDIHNLLPNCKSETFLPGDVININKHAITFNKQSSSLVKMTEDTRQSIKFNPTSELPPLFDPNPLNLENIVISKEIENILGKLFNFLNSDRAITNADLAHYYNRKSIFELKIIFPNNAILTKQFIFDKKAVKITNETNNCVDLSHQIAASVFVGWFKLKLSSFYVRAYSRYFNTTAAIKVEGSKMAYKPNSNIDILQIFIRDFHISMKERQHHDLSST